MKSLITLALTMTVLCGDLARAEGSIYGDAGTSLSYVSAKTPVTPSPSLVQYSFGATLGWHFAPSLFVGATADYRIANQLSEIKPGVGNVSGTRFSLLAPTVGATLAGFVLKLDVQLLGAYELAKPTASRQELSYTDPIGLGLTLLLPAGLPLPTGPVRWGIRFEQTKFRKQKNSVRGEQELPSPIVFTSFGITAAVVF